MEKLFHLAQSNIIIIPVYDRKTRNTDRGCVKRSPIINLSGTVSAMERSY